MSPRTTHDPTPSRSAWFSVSRGVARVASVVDEAQPLSQGVDARGRPRVAGSGAQAQPVGLPAMS